MVTNWELMIHAVTMSSLTGVQLGGEGGREAGGEELKGTNQPTETSYISRSF